MQSGCLTEVKCCESKAGKKTCVSFRWGALGYFLFFLACLPDSPELLSCTGLLKLWTAEICELHIFFSPQTFPLRLSFSPLLWAVLETLLGNGSSSQSTWSFKGDALFHACFTQIPSSLATCQVVALKASIQRQSPKPHSPSADGGVDLSAACHEMRSLHFFLRSFFPFFIRWSKPV